MTKKSLLHCAIVLTYFCAVITQAYPEATGLSLAVKFFRILILKIPEKKTYTPLLQKKLFGKYPQQDSLLIFCLFG